jgi:prepilin-type N-terminal cleavage/methylation domain-containing protein
MKNTLHTQRSGYTLIEIMIAVGLFALIMMLAAGAYLMMIGISRQAQGITSGIDNLAFALETMTRTIRTSTEYSCSDLPDATSCPDGGDTFSVRAPSGDRVSYTLATNEGDNGFITQATGIANSTYLTDSSVNVTSLQFYSTGLDSGDGAQARVTIVISGQVTSGIYKTMPIPFTIETSATMRGSDI